VALCFGVLVMMGFAISKMMSSEQEKKRAKIESEMIALDATAQGISTHAISSLLLSENPRAVHAAKKLLVVQTLRQTLFARNHGAFNPARQNWDHLAEQLTQHDPNPINQRWFEVFIYETRASEAGNGYSEEIAQIVSGPPLDTISDGELRPKVQALRTVSGFLRTWIIKPETSTALDTVRPLVMDEAARVAEGIKSASKRGESLEATKLYRLAFWQLYSSGLVIVADEEMKIESASMKFAEALWAWEEVGQGSVSRSIKESLAASAADFIEISKQLGLKK
jgi:hypothetical protein